MSGRPCFAVWCLLVAALAAGFGGCDKSNAKAEAGARERLVADLVARGDEAAATDKIGAWWAYSLAAVYAAEDASIAARKQAHEGATVNLSNEEMSALRDVLGSHLRGEDLRDWPAPAADMELVELRMLLDTTLLPHLRCSQMSMQPGGSTLVFVAKPGRTIQQVQVKYGDPSSRKEREGNVVLTYGRIRLIGASEGRIAGILFNL